MCRALRTYEAATAKGDDGRPDFAARKECNYLVSVLQVLQHTLQQVLQCSQGDQLLGQCASGEVFLWKQFQDVFKVNFDRS